MERIAKAFAQREILVFEYGFIVSSTDNETLLNSGIATSEDDQVDFLIGEISSSVDTFHQYLLVGIGATVEVGTSPQGEGAEITGSRYRQNAVIDLKVKEEGIVTR